MLNVLDAGVCRSPRSCHFSFRNYAQATQAGLLTGCCQGCTDQCFTGIERPFSRQVRDGQLRHIPGWPRCHFFDPGYGPAYWDSDVYRAALAGPLELSNYAGLQASTGVCMRARGGGALLALRTWHTPPPRGRALVLRWAIHLAPALAHAVILADLVHDAVLGRLAGCRAVGHAHHRAGPLVRHDAGPVARRGRPQRCSAVGL